MSKFSDRVAELLDAGAEDKGYGEALRIVCRSLPHALAEICYKAVRYHRRRDPSDLEKIAAWAALEWEDAHVNREGSTNGNSTGETDAWAVPPGHDQELRAFVRGDWGGSPGGGGNHAPAPAKRAKAHASAKSARGTGAVRGGDKHVGGKHRHRGGKGKP